MKPKQTRKNQQGIEISYAGHSLIKKALIIRCGRLIATNLPPKLCVVQTSLIEKSDFSLEVWRRLPVASHLYERVSRKKSEV